MQRLIVDMDGVLADAHAQFVAYDERDTNRRKTLAETLNVPELEISPLSNEHILLPGFFREAPVIGNSPEVLEQLNRKYDLYIVSAATEYPSSLIEKMAWLAEHFPFITWHQIVFCGSKKIVRGDIMIDDHFKNLDYFEGRTLLFTQPHNHSANPKHHQRVHSWNEVADLLL
ncbi:MAG TPA: 5'(3')-deoxyribonucleotidase [Verrucomicrobiae bacterium]|jgi:5'(3')-deoxyribonucleotidase